MGLSVRDSVGLSRGGRQTGEGFGGEGKETHRDSSGVGEGGISGGEDQWEGGTRRLSGRERLRGEEGRGGQREERILSLVPRIQSAAISVPSTMSDIAGDPSDISRCQV